MTSGAKTTEAAPGFGEVYNAIAGWDIRREGAAAYHRPTGDDVRHILAALRHAGLVIVPEEPTQAMLVAAGKVDDRAFATGSAHGASDEAIWHAMVEAAQ
jgi:hypothetical protein